MPSFHQCLKGLQIKNYFWDSRSWNAFKTIHIFSHWVYKQVQYHFEVDVWFLWDPRAPPYNSYVFITKPFLLLISVSNSKESINLLDLPDVVIKKISLMCRWRESTTRTSFSHKIFLFLYKLKFLHSYIYCNLYFNRAWN